VKPNQFVTIQEGKGIVSAAPIGFGGSRTKTPGEEKR
jgi:hypothetical protein